MSDNIIKGPWKNKVINNFDDTDQLGFDMDFADDLAEQLMVTLLTMYKDNGFDIQSQSFRQQIPFLNEVVRAIALKDMGYAHPLHDFIDEVIVTSNIKHEEKDISFSTLSIEKLEKLLKKD